MKTKIANVYSETDYDVFKAMKDNRHVDVNRLNKLIASFTQKDIMNPIIVNEHMEIVDGQGRYEARKRLGLPIIFIICEGTDADDCRRMNRYNSKWTNLDFAESYASSGNQNYVNLLEACKRSGYGVRRTLRLANIGQVAHGGNRKNGFEEGELVFGKDKIDKVLHTKLLTEEIVEALALTGKINDAFIVCVSIISNFKEYNHARMLKNCTSQRHTFAPMQRVVDQLKEFERIYNFKYGASNKVFSLTI